ncbi:MAG: hypothetical protein GY822_13870 [Deltaproteobacteria bacterium]|nr:hypothetical protein [Deltaproteobacteria bacterium]
MPSLALLLPSLALLFGVVGCLEEPDVGARFSCESTDDCPTGWSCEDALCRSGSGPRVVRLEVLTPRAGPQQDVRIRVETNGESFSELVPHLVIGDENSENTFPFSTSLVEGNDFFFELSLLSFASSLEDGSSYAIELQVKYPESDAASTLSESGVFVYDASPPQLAISGTDFRVDEESPFSFAVNGAKELADSASVLFVARRSDESCVLTFDALVSADGDQLIFSNNDEGDLPDGFDRCATRVHGSYDLLIFGAVDAAENVQHDDNQDYYSFEEQLKVDTRAPDVRFSFRTNNAFIEEADAPVLSPLFAGGDLIFCAHGAKDADENVDDDVFSEELTLKIELRGAAMTCSRTDVCDLECQWNQPENGGAVVDGQDRGTRLATLTVSDEVENTSTQVLEVQYDFESPSLTGIPIVVPNTTLRLNQKRNPNLQPESLGHRSTLTLVLGANEKTYFHPSAEKPAQYYLTCGDDDHQRVLNVLDVETLSPEPSTQVSLSLELQNSSEERVSCEVIVDVEDQHGNRAETVVHEIQLDTELPDVEQTIRTSSLSHARFPWGFFEGPDATGGLSRRGHAILGDNAAPSRAGNTGLPTRAFGFVSNEPDGAIEESVAFIRVYDSATGDNELSRISYSGDYESDSADIENASGEWLQQLPYATTDAAEIWLSVVDDAGNESIERKRIDKVTWIATMAGKTVGSTVENPHRFFAQPSFIGSASLAGTEETKFEAVDPIFTEPDNPPTGGIFDNELIQSDQAAVSFKGRGTWKNIGHDDVNPSLGLSYSSMAYDGDRNRTVFFGGGTHSQGDSPVQRLTEWNGLRFESRCDGTPITDTCSNMPQGRSGHESLWHRQRGGVWFVGGCGLIDDDNPEISDSKCEYLLPEVFRWDGERFEDLCDAGGCENARRIRHRLAYDEAKGDVYLFGGCLDTDCQVLDGQLYQWQENHFERVVVLGNGPQARGEPAFFYDPTQDELVVLGGCTAYSQADRTCTQSANDVWIMSQENGVATWINASATAGMLPDNSSSLRSAFAPTKGDDVSLGVHFVHGIDDYRIYTGQIRALTPAPMDVDSEENGFPYAPLPADADTTIESGFTLAWDTTLSRSWLNDGNVGLWTGSFFTTQNGNAASKWGRFRFAEKNVWPSAKQNATLLFDEDKMRLLLMGDTGADTETWSFDGTQWRRLCSSTGAANNNNNNNNNNSCGFSGKIQGSTFADVNDNVVPMAMSDAQVRTFDGAEWKEPTQTGPLPTFDAKGLLVRSSAENQGIFINPNGAASLLTVNSATSLSWDHLTSVLNPEPRLGAASTYDPLLEAGILFGGCVSDAQKKCSSSALQDQWVFNSAVGQWKTRTLFGETPSPRAYAGLEFDSSRERSILFGGCAGETCTARYYGDTFEYVSVGLNSGVWVEQEIADPTGDGQPVARAEAMTATSPSGGMLLFGGTNGKNGLIKNKLDDFWIWDGGANTQPGHIFEVDFAASGAPLGAKIHLAVVRWVGGGSAEVRDGATLLVWERGRWAYLQRKESASIDEPKVFSYPAAGADLATFVDDDRYQVWVHGPDQKMRFALVPGVNGKGRSRISSYYVDVTVRYSLPPLP